MIRIDDTTLDFEHACATALRFLHRRFGFDRWMVTQQVGDHWVVLTSEGDLASCQPADENDYVATISDLVMAGDRVTLEPALDGGVVRACVGMPLQAADGARFGVLCAVHSAPVTADVTADLSLLEMVAELLSSNISVERALHQERERAAEAEDAAMTDVLTGLFNRRGWDRLVASEESRCRRYGHRACVLSIDLDGLKRTNDRLGHAAGDELIRRTAAVLRAATREQDVVARIGGDEFAVLGVECGDARALAHGVQAELLRAGIEASVGYAERHPLRGLEAAQDQADATMYHRKRARRRQRQRHAAAAQRGWLTRRVS